MTEILKVSENLKSLIYGPTCSVQSPEDRAIAIEDNLAEILIVAEKLEEAEAALEEEQDEHGTTQSKLEDAESERDDWKKKADDSDKTLQTARGTLLNLIDALDASLVVGSMDRSLQKAYDAAKGMIEAL